MQLRNKFRLPLLSLVMAATLGLTPSVYAGVVWDLLTMPLQFLGGYDEEQTLLIEPNSEFWPQWMINANHTMLDNMDGVVSDSSTKRLTSGTTDVVSSDMSASADASDLEALLTPEGRERLLEYTNVQEDTGALGAAQRIGRGLNEHGIEQRSNGTVVRNGLHATIKTSTSYISDNVVLRYDHLALELRDVVLFDALTQLTGKGMLVYGVDQRMHADFCWEFRPGTEENAFIGVRNSCFDKKSIDDQYVMYYIDKPGNLHIRKVDFDTVVAMRNVQRLAERYKALMAPKDIIYRHEFANSILGVERNVSSSAVRVLQQQLANDLKLARKILPESKKGYYANLERAVKSAASCLKPYTAADGIIMKNGLSSPGCSSISNYIPATAKSFYFIDENDFLRQAGYLPTQR